MTDPLTAFDHPKQPLEDINRRLALESEANHLETVVLKAAQLADLALIMSGAYRPLKGFMNQADYEAVLENLRLENGQPFPLPVVLDVDLTTARAMETGKRISLRNGEGAAFAVLTVDDVWRKDARRESRQLGVAEDAYGRGSCYLGGSIEAIRPPAHPFFARLRPTPAALVEHLRKRGFNRVLSVECVGVIHRRHHRVIARAAAELDAAILLHPSIGTPDPGNPMQVMTIKSILAALPYFPPRTTLVALLEYPLRHAGLRGFLMHALLRKRYGATHFIMTGVTQRALDAEPRVLKCLGQIGVAAVPWPEKVFAGTSSAAASVSPGPTAGADFEHTALARKAKSGEEITADDTFPEVARVIETHYRQVSRAGFTLLFTGLSASGKSTIAKIVHARIAERDPRPVTLLDRGIAGKQFSKGLGFSKEERDTNVRRIGAAAADITKAGGVAICCTIAPYAETRKAVRAIIEPHGSMIEIHVATPLQICERRDPKGLYKKAREGRIENFTGVDDSYEAPQRPDIRLDASRGTPEEAAAVVVAHLQARGLIAVRDE